MMKMIVHPSFVSVMLMHARMTGRGNSCTTLGPFFSATTASSTELKPSTAPVHFKFPDSVQSDPSISGLRVQRQQRSPLPLPLLRWKAARNVPPKSPTHDDSHIPLSLIPPAPSLSLQCLIVINFSVFPKIP